MTPELWFHAIEITILFFGVTCPIVYGLFRLLSLMKDFPLHRHINGKIIYPSNYDPPVIEQLKS